MVPRTGVISRVRAATSSTARADRLSPTDKEPDRGRVTAGVRTVAPSPELEPLAGVDMGSGFAILYPTDMFLEVFGLPIADSEKLLAWIEGIFGGLLADECSGLLRSGLVGPQILVRSEDVGTSLFPQALEGLDECLGVDV
jgi:hypothetical protein